MSSLRHTRKFIVGGLLGVPAWMFVGLVLRLVMGRPTSMVVFEGDAGILASIVILCICVLGGACLAAYVSVAEEAQQRRQEAQRRQREAADAHEALQRRIAEEAQKRQREAADAHEALQRRIFEIRQLCSAAQDAALSLPVLLATADLELDRAEEHLAKPRYSPFWEGMEEATAKLSTFDEKLRFIATHRARHQSESMPLGGLAPPFNLGLKILPNPSGTHERLFALYLRAQEDRDFAQVYEQRRTVSKIEETNAILVAGFRSLDHAIRTLGDRVQSGVQELGRQLDCRLGGIQASLESAALEAAAQRTEILSSLESAAAAQRTENLSHARQSGGEELQWLRQDADRRTRHEAAVRDMLDNLQRKRGPSIFDARP